MEQNLNLNIWYIKVWALKIMIDYKIIKICFLSARRNHQLWQVPQFLHTPPNLFAFYKHQ